jgi:hypothetical protein
MDAMLKAVKSIEMDGLLWGASKLVPVGKFILINSYGTVVPLFCTVWAIKFQVWCDSARRIRIRMDAYSMTCWIRVRIPKTDPAVTGTLFQIRILLDPGPCSKCGSCWIRVLVPNTDPAGSGSLFQIRIRIGHKF